MSDASQSRPASSKCGLKALQDCQNQVKITIDNNFDDVPRLLRDSEILTRREYKDATDPMALLPKSRRVDLVFEKLTDMADQNESHYLTFVQILRTHTNSKKTVEMLDKAYAARRNAQN